MFQALLMALELYIVFVIVRFIYRWIRYICHLCALRKTFNRLIQSGITVTYKRKFKKIVFSPKGSVDIVLAKDGKQYGIALLTHRLSMGRWNIEKTRHHYFFEIYLSSIFYKLNNSSENIPDHVKDFGREQQAHREQMNFTPTTDGYDKVFLLLSPSPKNFTYTETRYTHLRNGDKIGEFEIIHSEQLTSLF